MPTVPDQDAPTVPQEPIAGRAIPRFSDEVPGGAFGGPIAEGISEVGRAGVEQQIKYRRENDQLRVIDANTQLEAGMQALLYGTPDKDGNMQGGAFSLHGHDAINMPSKFLPQFQTIADGINATLTPDQQRLFRAHIANAQNSLGLQLNRYEYEESNRLAAETFSNSIKQSVRLASVSYGDPGAVAKTRQDIAAAVRMQAGREGWSPEEEQEKRDLYLADMHHEVIARMLADGKPQRALAYFKTYRDSPELSGEQAHALGAQIDAALREQGAKNRNELAARIRDVTVAASNGQVIKPSDVPSRGAVMSTFEEDGPRVWDSLQKSLRMGADQKSMTGMKPEQILAMVEGYKPTQVEGAAEGYERYGIMRDAAQKILSARHADPMAAAINEGLGPQRIDWSNFDNAGVQLRYRAAAQQSLRGILGGDPGMLSRDESAQFANALTHAPAEQQLKMLVGLRGQIDNDQDFFNVMRAIAPQSPVVALAGSRRIQSDPLEAPTFFDARFALDPRDTALMLKGEKLLNPIGGEKGEREKTGVRGGFPMPPESGQGGVSLRERWANYSQDAFIGRPEMEDQAYSAFKAAYAGIAQETGNFSGKWSSTIGDKAARIVLGQTTPFAHHTMPVPDGMDPTRFQAHVEAAINAVGRKAGWPDGDLTDKIKGYSIAELGELGSGRYVVTSGNRVLDRKDGRGPLIIDLRNQYLSSNGAVPTNEDLERVTKELNPAARVGPLQFGGEGVPVQTSRIPRGPILPGRPAAPPAAEAPTVEPPEGVEGRGPPPKESAGEKPNKGPPVKGLGTKRSGGTKEHPSQE